MLVNKGIRNLDNGVRVIQENTDWLTNLMEQNTSG
jgi:hypothetical protein